MLEIPEEVILRCWRHILSTLTSVLLSKRVFHLRTWRRLVHLVHLVDRSSEHSRRGGNLNWVNGVVNLAWLFNSSLSTVIPSQMLIRIPLYEPPALNAALGESLLNVGKLFLGLTVIHD